MPTFAEAFARCPLVAILRGVEPDEVLEICRILVDVGYTLIEVPLNSPEPLKSVSLLADELGEHALIGAGTVLSVDEVGAVAAAGGQMIVSPNADPDVVAETKRRGLVSIPGFATPTEAFRVLAAGADALKLFPAEALPPAVLKAMKAVLPPDVPVLPVGGIGPDNMAAYAAAGAAGFGLGSSLYKPGKALDAIARDAGAIRDAWATTRG